MANKLDILVTTYGPQGQAYLDLCLKSLEAQTFKNFRVFVASSGEFKPVVGKRDIEIHHFHYLEQKHFSAALKEIYDISKPTADSDGLILILNDDVILAHDCIEKMEYYFHDEKRNFISVNPLSNCDNYKNYLFPLRFHKNGEPVFYKQQYKIDDVKFDVDNIIYKSFNLGPGLLYPEYNAFYCTMMSRKLYDEVGGIDPSYRTGKDDLDFAKRMRKKAKIPICCTDAFCFHFSGITANISITQEDRDFNEKYFKEKFG